jgi:hypothetical protein
MASSLIVLESATDGRWSPGIGDPSWAGWLTVGAYAIAAILAWAAHRSYRSDVLWLERSHDERARAERLLAAFWLVAFAVLTALGFNKQLDLQSLFTQELRDAARLEGWYDERRRYQFFFVAAIAGAGVLTMGAMAWILRAKLREVWVAVLGLGGLTSFVVIRAASFHHVDTFLRRLTHAGNVALELSAIAMIAAGAWRALRSRSGDRLTGGGPAAASIVTVTGRDPSASGTP